MLAIKAEGGVTFAQDSNSAKHYEMPRSSIAAGAVDIVLPPEEIARNLSCINGHPSPTLIEESDEIAPREVNVASFKCFACSTNRLAWICRFTSLRWSSVAFTAG